MRSESGDLNLLANLVGRLFKVPVAYAAMLGHPDRVMCRIGSGSTHWKDLKTLPVQRYLMAPMVIQDFPADLPEGADLGDLLFAATAPIDTLCGQHLGLLVIADRVTRPEFSSLDLENLQALASMFANRIELRMIAAQSFESKMLCFESEHRFRALANEVPTLIACNDADGSWGFVNDAWLRFTGRNRREELGDGWQQQLHPRHRARVLNDYVCSLQTRQLCALEMPVRRHDGIYRWVRCSGTPRFLTDRTFAGFTLFLIELSDYDEAAEIPKAEENVTAP